MNQQEMKGKSRIMASNRSTYSQLKSYCRVQDTVGEDRFVGFRIVEDSPEVLFPFGYRFPTEFGELQADISSLIITIQRAARTYPEIELEQGKGAGDRIAELPFQDYMVLIQDYLETSALYAETLSEYRKSKSGIISWPRTIAKIGSVLSSSKQPIYLDFITKHIRTNEDALVTLIHEHCLFLAFNTIGWLFTPRKFPEPRLVHTTLEHLHVVARRLGTVFNDRNRRLLTAMFNILSRDSSAQIANFEFGTERFEYVWEYMIDRAFGEQAEEKRKYFPSAEWQLITGRKRIPAPLEPDTIMIDSGNLYVLDAKYYRFGVTDNPSHLPGTSDIGKQVIYGQYARKITAGVVTNVLNAFIIPGKVLSTGTWCRAVALARPSWVDKPKSYEHVLTVVIDTSHLLRHYDDIGVIRKQDLGWLIENEVKRSQMQNSEV